MAQLTKLFDWPKRHECFNPLDTGARSNRTAYLRESFMESFHNGDESHEVDSIRRIQSGNCDPPSTLFLTSHHGILGSTTQSIADTIMGDKLL